MSSKLPTIIDNNKDNTLLTALSQLMQITRQLDVGTGRFEIGSLLSLGSTWHGIEKMRILSGDETSSRTRDFLVKAVVTDADSSIEQIKERDDALTGLEFIKEAFQRRLVETRIFTKSRFHGKCYLMDASSPSPVDFAIVGSSNFSISGLTKNLELNLLTTDQLHYGALKAWFDDLWNQAVEVNDDILRVIDKHLLSHEPFTAYARSVHAYFANREKSVETWELTESALYPMLAKYQRDGYHRAIQIAENWRGALVCDGVGLGKTFIGLMVLERYIRENKNVLLIVPKSAEQSVWRNNIDKYLKPKYGKVLRNNLEIKRHTDFGREGGISDDDMEYFKQYTNAIIIDEAHHFRNRGNNRGKQLLALSANKDLYLLTATPINNGLDDLYNLINYFAQNDPAHFSSIRIHNLRKHFLENERRLEASHAEQAIADAADTEDFLRTDELLRHVLIQRSRKYVKDSESTERENVLFPERQMPKVVNYSLRNVYASLYQELKEAFDKVDPFLTLAIYNTAAYHKDPNKRLVQQQRQIIGLIRTLLLKRLESSFKAFEASVEDLLAKMADFLRTHSQAHFDSWEHTNTRWWSIVQAHILERLEQEGGSGAEEEDTADDFEEDGEARFNPAEHHVDRLVQDLVADMELLTSILSKIYRRFYDQDNEGEKEDPSKDGKWIELKKLLEEDPIIKNQKVLIFSEFRDTARYLHRRITGSGHKHVEIVDSGRNVTNREQIIKRFSPYYNNNTNDAVLKDLLAHRIDILISTDVLSEGLNLQDASLIINYDLHWNPVRLMQRIGRVDRRLNPEIEEKLDRPAKVKGKVYFWNFLPPAELEDLLHLKKRLDGKILRISKTLGIESPVITPDEEADSLKLFNERYEGIESIEELLSIEKQKIEAELGPEKWNELGELPKRLFSGKIVGDGFESVMNADGKPVADLEPNMKPGLFCCYQMPTIIDQAAKDLLDVKYEVYDSTKHLPGEVRWYFYDFESNKVTEDLKDTWTAVKCKRGTPRYVSKGVENLTEARMAIEKHIKNTYLRDAQTPIGAKPTLMAWIETSQPTK